MSTKTSEYSSRKFVRTRRLPGAASRMAVARAPSYFSSVTSDPEKRTSTGASVGLPCISS